MKTALVLLLALVCSISISYSQPNQKKITVYTDEFVGNKLELGPGQYDNMHLIRGGVITVKSVRVPKGMKVTLYSHDQFEGQSLELTEDANTAFLEARGYAQTVLSVSLVVEVLVNPAATTGLSVTIYRDDFSGASQLLVPGTYEPGDLGNVGNDQLSSIKIPPGLKVTLYEHGGFKGRTLILRKDTRASYLTGNKFNDLTSSILVEEEPTAVPVTLAPGVVIVTPTTGTQPVTVSNPVVINAPAEPIIYAGDFSGASKTVVAGRYSSDQLGIGNDQLSSIKVPAGFRVTLYEGDAFEGRSLVLTKDARASSLADNNFNNLTSSIFVEVIPMVTLFEGDYNGVSARLEPGRYAGHNFGIGNDQLSSVRIPAGLRVTLFEDESFRGRSVVLTQDAGMDVLTRNGFNNEASSVIVDLNEQVVPAVAVAMATLYSDDLAGSSISFPPGRYTSSQLGIGDNALSSMQIPRGLEVTVYENDNFTGRQMTVRSDTRADFFVTNEFNDIASSVEVRAVPETTGLVTVYSDRFGGASQSFGVGRYSLRDLNVGDNQISSARVPNGLRVIMYEDDNFAGYSVTAERDIDLSQAFNDRVSSIVVEDLFTPVVSPPRNTRPTGVGGRRPASSVAGAGAAVAIVPPPAAPTTTTEAQPPPCAMNASQFQNAFNSIKGKSWDSDKIEMARISTKDRCLSVSQIREVSQLFDSEDVSLEFVKSSYDRSTERTEYYLLQDLFRYPSTQQAFTQFLQSK